MINVGRKWRKQITVKRREKDTRGRHREEGRRKRREN